MSDTKVTAILLNWKREENLIEVISSIKKQSMPVKICLWNNNFDDKKEYDVDMQINSPENFKCWPRWTMGSMIDSEFVFTLDDDLKLRDEKVIEDVLNFYLTLDPNLNPIVGYTGVSLNEESDYWRSRHLTEPDEIDRNVDIIKGRFMFMGKGVLEKMTLENDPTCEDIKVSSVSQFKIIPSFLSNRFLNLEEFGVGLFGSESHEENRVNATRRYFGLKGKKDLNSLMNFYGSDKGGCGRFSCHNYTDFYEMLFKEIRSRKNNVFEIGLGSNDTSIPSNMGPLGKPGASLRAWRDYFSNSLIYGADIDKNSLFSEERIETFYCDQTNPGEILKMWSNEILENKEFDIIIDDGLHEYEANMIFFENSIFKLKKGGYYIIEDINPRTFDLIRDNVDLIKEKHKNLNFSLMRLYLKNNDHDNNLLVIQKKS